MTKHAYTKLDLPADIAGSILSFSLDPKHVLKRETEPHVTVKFALDATHEQAAEALKGEFPVRATFGTTSLFKTPDADVLKVEVTGHGLHALHRKLNRLPHDDSHAVYVPHATIAFLKPGEGRKYSGKSVRRLTGRTVTLRSVAYSDKDGTVKHIPLEGNSRA